MILYNNARQSASTPLTRAAAACPFRLASAASSSGTAGASGPRSSSNAIWLAAAAPEAASSSQRHTAAPTICPPCCPKAWAICSSRLCPLRRCSVCRNSTIPLAAALPASTQSQLRPASTMAAGTLSAHSPHARLCRGVSLSCKLHPSVLRRQQLRRADLIPADQRRARKRERQRPRVRL